MLETGTIASGNEDGDQSWPLKEKLERARTELLDLSTRNRLISTPRGTKAKQVEIIDELSAEIFRLLVNDGKALTFLPGRKAAGAASNEQDGDSDEISELAQPDDDAIDERGRASRHSDTKLQTRLTSEGLQKRLLDLCLDARTLQEEQGVNILYLALGMLKWFEDEKSEKERFAPLILLPVMLDRGSAGERFKLRWLQEEPAANLSLGALMKRQFGLELPQFTEGDEAFDPTSYFARVAAAVAGQPRWAVLENDVTLGLFSFAKFLMYRDLDPDLWPAGVGIADSPIVAGLLGDGFKPGDGMIGEDEPVDPHIDPEQLVHVVDADSSQTMAVHEVRRGRDMVIQGPPGTGKSQTIANVIASAVYDGKTVLFVAEKMAALEVVKRRLDANGIGDICLELHSNKANKRYLLEELRRTWDLGRPSGTEDGALIRQLRQNRDKLNEHVQRLHRRQQPCGLSPYQVIGHLVRLRQTNEGPAKATLVAPETWSRPERQERELQLKDLAGRIDDIGPPSQHPWRGAHIPAITPMDAERMVVRLRGLLGGYQQFSASCSQLCALLEIGAPNSLQDVEGIISQARRVAAAPALDQTTITDDVWISQKAQLAALVETGEKVTALLAQLAAIVTEVARDQDLAAAGALLNKYHAGWLIAQETNFSSARATIVTFNSHLATLKTALGLQYPSTLTSVVSMLRVVERAAAVPSVDPDALLHDVWKSHGRSVTELVELGSTYEEQRRELVSTFTAEAWMEQKENLIIVGTLLTKYRTSWLIALEPGLTEVQTNIKYFIQYFNDLKTSLSLQYLSTINSAQYLLNVVGHVSKAPPFDPDSLLNDVWKNRGADIADLVDVGIAYAEQKQELDGVFTAAAWDTDVKSARQHLATHATSFFRFLNGDFKRAKVLVDSILTVPGTTPISEQLKQLDKLIANQKALARLSADDELGRTAFGSLWRRERSDWSSLEKIVTWVKDSGVGESASDVRRIAATTKLNMIQSFSRPLEGAIVELKLIAHDFIIRLQKTASPVFPAEAIDDIDLAAFSTSLDNLSLAAGTLAGIFANPPQSLHEQRHLLERLKNLNATAMSLRAAQGSEETSLGYKAFGTHWRDESSDWSHLRKIIEWVQGNGADDLANEIRRIAAITKPQVLQSLARPVEQAAAELRSTLSELAPRLQAAAPLAFPAEPLDEIDVEALAAALGDLDLAAGTLALIFARPPQSLEEQRQVLKQLADLKATAAKLDVTVEAGGPSLGQKAFGVNWQGERSDWTHLRKIVDWAGGNGQGPAASVIHAAVARGVDQPVVASLADYLAKPSPILVSKTNEEFRFLSLDRTAAFGTEGVELINLTVLMDQIGLWIDRAEDLSKWTAYTAKAGLAREAGLADLVERLEDGRLNARSVLPEFEKSYYEVLFNGMVNDDPELARFDGDGHSRMVEEFARLDHKRIHLARREVAAIHHQRIPRQEGGAGPLGVLKGEIVKRRNHLPIRQLMKKAGPAIQALKPVFMMSPLSVAQFLEPGSLTFDMLVVDEASQIQPVDAIGAIARCRQIVVVGDDKQLPPTRFFDKMLAGNDDDDSDDPATKVADVESILGLCVSKGLPQRMLRWHYRSRHQSLIAISNREFYENKLYIVPSPYTAEAGMGLRFHYFPHATYDTGGTSTNVEEAKEVAKAIIQHARSHPDLSLGVATFSTKQRRAVLDEVERLRRLNPDTEPFFSAHPAEPFFIKNLENVQGDERDVIFISVGYGKNAQGYMSMSFGPLNRDGGERRLNVLISRAKRRCEVFSSITDEDIDLERAKGKGVFAFKLFLHFARTGNLSIGHKTDREHDSVFEEQVANALKAQGYNVHAQVGLAGFFIDLAVADFDRPGRYVLGIECDGAAYHSSRSARDRDRLRQSVLEDHGWIIHRIWSTDWFNRPQQQLAKVIAAIEAAKEEVAAREGAAGRHARAVPIEIVTVEREHVTEVGLRHAGHANEAASGSSALAVPYVQATLSVPTDVELHEVTSGTMENLVTQVIAVEGPIHLDEIVTRLREHWGLQRAGGRIRQVVARGVDSAVRSGVVSGDGDFYTLSGFKLSVRDRSETQSPGLRKPEMLPPSEIQQAIITFVAAHLGATEEEAITGASRLFGFKATSAQLKQLIVGAITAAEQAGMLVRQGDLLRVPAES